ncbi:Aspartate aminotransferase, cytoplasmic [Microbotryomycetes sp. JL221]|nr:Aspartate aminotransferase, cytoplasmic [Microbotryomycetes sp. JL221]
MASAFDHVPLQPPDAIFALTAGYNADKSDKKVNLGVGAYRDNAGKPFVLPVVRKAKKILADDDTLDHEYLPIAGLPTFTSATSKLIFGADSKAIKEGRVCTIQTISGTGANHYAAEFLQRFYGPWQGKTKEERKIYISNPTWANHKSIIQVADCTPVDYPYYDSKTIGLNLTAFIDFLRQAPEQSVILLHACAHNPTGVDPTRDQWREIAEIFLAKRHFAFFDCAYQGFASGDLDNDAWAVRHFVDRSIPLLVCQSYAKNAGLYGERIGALNIVATKSGDVEGGAKRITSQLQLMQRSEISNPPTFGARIVALILNDEQLFKEWKRDIETMAHRIIKMREALYDLLTNKYKSPSPGPNGWKHITDQIGMFSFTGLNAQQCKDLLDKCHIYLTANGRISMAGLNESNVEYFASCVDKAHAMTPFAASSSWPLLSLLTLLTAYRAVERVDALSAHSPQDLYASPRYNVALRTNGVLNDTVAEMLHLHETQASSSQWSSVHVMRTPTGQAFICTIPKINQDDGNDLVASSRHKGPVDLVQLESQRHRGLERGLALLEPMKGGCLYQKQHWFTYSFCYGDKIRQFHEIRVAGSPAPTEDPHSEAYTLGYSPEPVGTEQPKYGSGSNAITRPMIPATLGGGGGPSTDAAALSGTSSSGGSESTALGSTEGGRYLSQIWEDGTICDKTNMPRTVEVQFHCNTQTIDRIALIRETSICRYVMIIHTPRLCSEAVFAEGRDASSEPIHQIECRPVVSKSRSTVDSAPRQHLGEEAGRGAAQLNHDSTSPTSLDSSHSTAGALGSDPADTATMHDDGSPEDMLGEVPPQSVETEANRDALSDALNDQMLHHPDHDETALDHDEDFEVVEIGYILDPTTGEVRQATTDEMDLALKDGASEFVIDADFGPEADDLSDVEVERALVEKMEDMAKVMRESIANALNNAQDVKDGAEEQDEAAADIAGDSQDDYAEDSKDGRTVSDVFAAVQSALEKAKRDASINRPGQKPTFDLSRLRAMLKDSLGARNKLEHNVLGAEEHSKLLRMFQKTYDDVNELEGDDGDEARHRRRLVRDEL